MSQQPTHGQAKTYSDLWRIVTHPAFRLGVLDAQSGNPLDHDRIIERIASETPTAALERLRWDGLFEKADIAQCRYEEGRLVVILVGLRCKAWSHPDYPPMAVKRYIRHKAAKSA